MKTKHKIGSYEYGQFVDDEFMTVCDEYENPSLPAYEIRRQFTEKLYPQTDSKDWPQDATEKEIRAHARETLEKLIKKAGIKKED